MPQGYQSVAPRNLDAHRDLIGTTNTGTGRIREAGLVLENATHVLRIERGGPLDVASGGILDRRQHARVHRTSLVSAARYTRRLVC